jgi:hypothetical protein
MTEYFIDCFTKKKGCNNKMHILQA